MEEKYIYIYISKWYLCKLWFQDSVALWGLQKEAQIDPEDRASKNNSPSFQWSLLPGQTIQRMSFRRKNSWSPCQLAIYFKTSLHTFGFLPLCWYQSCDFTRRMPCFKPCKRHSGWVSPYQHKHDQEDYPKSPHMWFESSKVSLLMESTRWVAKVVQMEYISQFTEYPMWRGFWT